MLASTATATSTKNTASICVATDVISGEEVILRRGELVPAPLASCAIPGVFPTPPT